MLDAEARKLEEQVNESMVGDSMSKRKRGRRRKPRRSSRSPARSPSSEYRQAVRKADQVLSISDIEVRSDNWQQLALDWFAPDEPDRSEMARYIAAHERQLGVAWARELLRLEVLFQAEESLKQLTRMYDGHAFESKGEALIKTLMLLRGWQCQPQENGQTVLDIIVAERNELLSRRARALNGFAAVR